MNDYQYITLCENLNYKTQICREFIENEMHTQKEQVLQSLSQVVAHSYIQMFSKVLLYGWSEGCPEAEKIANHLNLSKLDFLALSENLQEYEEEYLRDQEGAQLNDYEYYT